jgi:hypothetical protein
MQTLSVFSRTDFSRVSLVRRSSESLQKSDFEIIDEVKKFIKGQQRTVLPWPAMLLVTDRFLPQPWLSRLWQKSKTSQA